MKQEKQKQESPLSGILFRLPGGDSLRVIFETWAFLKDFSRKPTCAEEMGWPEWPQWF